MLTRTRFFRRALQALGLLILSATLVALGALFSLGRSLAVPPTRLGRWSARWQRGAAPARFAPLAETRELIDAAFYPQQLFPGQSRLNILCLGLDRDWTDQDLPSSKRSRTDTMIVASLDLRSHRVAALSIPRDSRVEIPRHGLRKINDAYPLGGIDCTRATVQHFLDAPLDHYVLVRLGAVQRFVDAIGGITLDVEKDMDYDDDWGQLHVHLRHGLQHLGGVQFEAYMRFRHDREGDFGRMRRQQQTIRAILARLQSPAIAFRLPRLLDAFRRSVDTDLTRDQILALARLFHPVRPDAVLSDTIPGRNRMIDGVAYVEPNLKQTNRLVAWLLRGDESAANPLTRVRVLNGCHSRRAARAVVRQLAARQFTVTYGGRAAADTAITRVEGHGRHSDAGQRVLAALRGGTLRWEPGPEPASVTVIVGQDQAAGAVERAGLRG